MFQLGEVLVENESQRGRKYKLFFVLKGGIERLNDNHTYTLPWNT